MIPAPYPYQPSGPIRYAAAPRRRGQSASIGSIRSIVHRLAWAEVGLSGVIFGFAGICIATAALSIRAYLVANWFGIISGVVGVISAGLGIGAFRSGRSCHHCLFIGHFVMCIIAAFLDFIQLALSFVFFSLIHHAFHLPDTVWALIVVTCILFLTSAAHMVCCIVSTAFTCKLWLTQNDCETVAVYTPSEEVINTPNMVKFQNGMNGQLHPNSACAINAV